MVVKFSFKLFQRSITVKFGKPLADKTIFLDILIYKFVKIDTIYSRFQKGNDLTQGGGSRWHQCLSYRTKQWRIQDFPDTETTTYYLAKHFPKPAWKQECIPVGCVPPARNHTVGGLPDRDPPGQKPPPKQRPPWTETPLDRDPPRQRPSLDRDPQDRDPLRPLWTETPPWTEPPPGQRPPYRNRITDRCKNITLPQLRCGR